jgi:hypothetical protein
MNNSIQSPYPSIKLDQLVYVELPSNNGGMMLSISEEGFSFRAVSPVQPGGPIAFSFATNGFDKLGGYGKIDWTDDDGKVAGLQFTDVSAEFKSALSKWLKRMRTPVAAPFVSSTSAAPPAASFDQSTTVDESKKTRVSEFAKILGSESKSGTRNFPAEAARIDSESTSLDDRAVPPVESPRNEPKLALPMFREWEYPKDLQDQSRSRVGRVAFWAIGICAAVLTLVLFGYHQYVGESLISLGHQISVPPAAPLPQTPSPPTQASVKSAPVSEPVTEKEPTPPVDSSRTQNQSPVEPTLTTPVQSEDSSRQEKREISRRASFSRNATAKTRTPQSRLEGGVYSDQSHALWSAVAHGSTSAEVSLATLYLIGGGGVTKSCVQARILLQAAAKKGNGVAIDKLAQLNRQGCP